MKGKCGLVWFKNDLRVHDNEVLTRANEQSTTLLPVYIFDPRDFSKVCSKIEVFDVSWSLERMWFWQHWSV